MNKFLDYFKLKEEHRNIKPFTCKFKEGLNIIVGENGSGKSTMLRLLDGKKDKIFSYKMAKSGLVDTRFLDTERQNPRYENLNYSSNALFAAMSHFTSHGESILPLVEACRSMKNLVVFIDEPEAGISLKNQKEILKSFNKSVKNGCQLIVTTHSYVLINKVKEVFCLDNFKWMPSREYLRKVL